MSITTRGTWPGQLTLRRGWAKAVARPWNDDVSAIQLRLIRGSKDFVVDASDELAELYGQVVSPPLPDPGTKLWVEAGYKPWLYLDLYSRDLNNRVLKPTVVVTDGTASDWHEAVEIDAASFEPLWRLGTAGLAESREATPRSTFLVSRLNGDLVGFAIVGVAGAVSYLQRVAVRPECQGRGSGKSLVRSAMRWGQKHGASSMLLNTQPDNAAASGLYLSEGFTKLLAGLHVLSFEPD